MKTIALKKLTIENFKGIRQRQIDFGRTTEVFGANATGKTTLMDAFLWLMFGKDSNGRADFQIRPVDEAGRMVDGVEITVEAEMEISGSALTTAETVTLKKTQRQNWVTKRGTNVATFSGNTNSYSINGFPASQSEFGEKVASMIDEDLFRLLTNPRAFASMKWQEQRQILLRFVSDVTDAHVLDLDPETFSLVREDVMAAGAEKAKEKAVKALRALNEEQKAYPIRIDEAMRSTVTGIDADAVGAIKAELEAELEKVLAERTGIKASEEVSNLQAEMMRIKFQMSDIEREEHEKVRKAKQASETAYEDAEYELRKMEKTRDKNCEKVQLLTAEIAAGEAEIKKLADTWRAEKARKVTPDMTTCPQCGRPFEGEELERIIADFGETKKKKLANIEKAGTLARFNADEAKAEREQLQTQIKEATDAIAEQQAHVDALKAIAETDIVAVLPQAYHDLQEKLDGLQARINALTTDKGREDAITAKEQAVRTGIAMVDADLAKLAAADAAMDRVEELKEEQMDCSQKVADQEQKVFLLEEFMKLKMNLLSEKINSHFSKVRFKLFETQINGAVKETCVMQIASNGSYVDYPNANNAHQIIGGLDVIDALSKLYGVTAPVWLDNAECMNDFNIPQMDAQMILLKVSDDAELTVEVTA